MNARSGEKSKFPNFKKLNRRNQFKYGSVIIFKISTGFPSEGPLNQVKSTLDEQ